MFGMNSLCLSVDDDRYAYLVRTFTHVGIPAPMKFPGINLHSPMGAGLGHLGMVMHANAMGYEVSMMFEEDAYPRINAMEVLSTVFHDIPEDCGMLVVGFCGLWNGRNSLCYESEHHCAALSGIMGIHAYIIFKGFYQNWMKALSRAGWDPEKALGWEHYNDSRLKPYLLKEQVFIQKNLTDKFMAQQVGKCTGETSKGCFFYPDSKTMKRNTKERDLPEGFVSRMFQDEPVPLFVSEEWR